MAKGWHQTEQAKKQISETMKSKIASGELKRDIYAFVSAGNILYHITDYFELNENRKWKNRV